MLKLLKYNDMIAPIFSIIGNVLLFYLILTVNKLNMKQISFVLIPNCILDIALALMTFAMAPVSFCSNKYCLILPFFSLYLQKNEMYMSLLEVYLMHLDLQLEVL